MDLIAMGNRIRTIRESRGMTQDQLATASGISIKHISVIERGMKDARSSTISGIADALGVTPNDLMLDMSQNREFAAAFQNKISGLPQEKQEKVMKVVDTLLETI